MLILEKAGLFLYIRPTIICFSDTIQDGQPCLCWFTKVTLVAELHNYCCLVTAIIIRTDTLLRLSK